MQLLVRNIRQSKEIARSDPGGANSFVDPMDLDPKHWSILINILVDILLLGSGIQVEEQRYCWRSIFKNPIFKICLGEEILNVFKVDVQYMENEEKYTVETFNQLIKHLNDYFWYIKNV